MKKNVNLIFRNGNWYANYRVKVKDEAGNLKTVQRQPSTRQTDKKIAQSVANKMREEDWAVFNGIGPVSRAPLRDTTTTVGELLVVFRKHRVGLRGAPRVEAALLAVLAEGNLTDDKKAVRKMHLGSLSERIMLAFRSQIWRRAAYAKNPKNQDVKPRSDITVNTVIRMAKSAFSARAMEAYRGEGLKLPKAAIESFMSASFLPQSKDAMTYHPPAAITWAQMDGSIPIMHRLARWHDAGGRSAKGWQWLNAFMTYQIMRRWGLRNSEVENLRWDWFRARDDGKLWLELIPRGGEWKPKGKSRSFAVDAGFVAELRKLSPPMEPTDYVLGGTMTDRHRGANHCIGAFVRRFVTEEDQEKSAYILRKQFGSEMVLRHDMPTASHLLGHSSISVTESHYAGNLKVNSLPPL